MTLLPSCPRLRSLSVALDSRTSLSTFPLTIQIFAQLTYLRLCFRPFDISILDRLLNSVPQVRRFSLETLVYNTDYMRSPFWTTRFQQQLPSLERIRLIIRGWFVLKTTHPQTTEVKFDGTSVIDSYRFDRYWLDRAYKRVFHCHVESCAAVLQIR